MSLIEWNSQFIAGLDFEYLKEPFQTWSREPLGAVFFSGGLSPS